MSEGGNVAGIVKPGVSCGCEPVPLFACDVCLIGLGSMDNELDSKANGMNQFIGFMIVAC